jgi:hypothetical protein
MPTTTRWTTTTSTTTPTRTPTTIRPELTMTIEMERTELAAREGIRHLLARYTWAGDRGAAPELAACFHVDGVLDMGDHGGVVTGRDAIEASIGAVVRRAAAAGGAPTPVNHHVTSVLIELHDPSTAVVRAYYCVYTDAGADHWGSYRDEVAMDPADGAWRFRRRTVRVTGAAATSRFVAG